MEELPGRVPEETPGWCQAQELMAPAAEPSWSGILASLPFASAFSPAFLAGEIRPGYLLHKQPSQAPCSLPESALQPSQHEG